MKLIIAISALLAVAIAAPQQRPYNNPFTNNRVYNAYNDPYNNPFNRNRNNPYNYNRYQYPTTTRRPFIQYTTSTPEPVIQYATTGKPIVEVRPVQRSDDSRNAIILRYDNDNIGVDGYNYVVETSDGQSKSEQGQLINPGTDAEAIAVSGQYSYTGPDGVLYTVTYTADQDGFHPQGAHLPKSA